MLRGGASSLQAAARLLLVFAFEVFFFGTATRSPYRHSTIRLGKGSLWLQTTATIRYQAAGHPAI